MTATFRWLGGFTVRIDGPGGVLYVDPWRLKENSPPAAAILLTNPRPGHASVEDVALVRTPETVVAGTADALAAAEVEGTALAPGDRLPAAGFAIEATLAANRELAFFPREKGWLGYRIAAGGRSFWHAGATDRLPEHEGIRADVAFVPVSGRYLMGPEEALAAAEATGAEVRTALLLVGDLFRPFPGFSAADPAERSGPGAPRS